MMNMMNVEAIEVASMGTLVRTDKNGTKIYNGSVKCPRCGGKGYLSYYGHVENGVCFKCEGNGSFPKEIKVYTPEYAKKLEEKREKARLKKEQEEEKKMRMQFEKWKLWNGFSAEGVTYLFLGNTYEIKDELKTLGARFDFSAGWHIGHPVEGYETVMVKAEDTVKMDASGNGIWKSKEYFDELKKAEYNRLHPVEAEKASHYVGKVGDTFESTVTLVNSYNYETSYGFRETVMTIYVMEDESGNKLVWKTSGALTVDDEPVLKGETISIKGKIKEHSTYRDEEQTILTRCKATAVA